MTFVKRSDKVAFMEGSNSKYNRMKGFTSLSTNKNPKEYTRQYVDEGHETTDVVAISTSMDFAFDQRKEDVVHQKIAGIIDGEKIGDEAIVNVVIVDFTKPGLADGVFKATKRTLVVVPGSEGDSMDAYTYSGTFKAKGAMVEGEVETTDNWETCTFTEGTITVGP